LRSPSSAAVSSLTRIVTEDFDGGPVVAGASAVVHWPQNVNPGGFSEWHLGQTSTSAAAHCPQNFIPAGFSNPHFEQRMSPAFLASKHSVQ
jgi:hypothetical protein